MSQALRHNLLPRCVGDTVGRLVDEFGGGMDGNAIASVVIGAYRDLQGCSGPALPELVERSSRQRLLGLGRPLLRR